MRICKFCTIEKSEVDFHKDKSSRDGYSNKCKLCKKQYRIDNIDRIKEYDHNRYKATIEYQRDRHRKYRLANNIILNERNKKWRDDNKEYLDEYYILNKCRKISNANIYKKNRYKTDILYRLKTNIRNLINKSFRYSSMTKCKSSESILGCTIVEFREYLESNFEPWMTWENKGLYNGSSEYGWDIDHIIPISSAKTLEEILLLNNYTNLRPLCSHYNRDKKKNNL